MTDILKVLLRKNSLRKQCQELTVTDIEKVIADLTDILEGKREEEVAEQEANRARDEKIAEIRQAMKAAGIGYDDLKDIGVSVPRKKVEAKYRIVDEDGMEHEWTGRGRTPVVFQQYFEKHGATKEDCLID